MNFSIRDLLLVTVIVAVCVAWGVDHQNRLAEARKFEERWSATKAELARLQKRAELNEKIVSALRRAGFDDAHHQDGTVTIEKPLEIRNGFDR